MVVECGDFTLECLSNDTRSDLWIWCSYQIKGSSLNCFGNVLSVLKHFNNADFRYVI